VARPVVQGVRRQHGGCAGAKGVLITTSTFSRDAEDDVARIERKIVLIDGPTLAELVIDHRIGVLTAGEYVLKRVDSDCFTEEEA
jgi:restriction system protein